MVEYPGVLDTAFGALSDPTRRGILQALRAGPASVSDLAVPYEMSLQAISKHVGVLAGAGLVAREKRGRVQWVSLNPEPMRLCDEWLGDYRVFWEEQLDSFGAFLREQEEKER
jgi:DNA-binding transcriptional ArsR family regulator